MTIDSNLLTALKALRSNQLCGDQQFELQFIRLSFEYQICQHANSEVTIIYVSDHYGVMSTLSSKIHLKSSNEFQKTVLRYSRYK